MSKFFRYFDLHTTSNAVNKSAEKRETKPNETTLKTQGKNGSLNNGKQRLRMFEVSKKKKWRKRRKSEDATNTAMFM